MEKKGCKLNFRIFKVVGIVKKKKGTKSGKLLGLICEKLKLIISPI